MVKSSHRVLDELADSEITISGDMGQKILIGYKEPLPLMKLSGPTDLGTPTSIVMPETYIIVPKEGYIDCDFEKNSCKSNQVTNFDVRRDSKTGLYNVSVSVLANSNPNTQYFYNIYLSHESTPEGIEKYVEESLDYYFERWKGWSKSEGIFENAN